MGKRAKKSVEGEIDKLAQELTPKTDVSIDVNTELTQESGVSLTEPPTQEETAPEVLVVTSEPTVETPPLGEPQVSVNKEVLYRLIWAVIQGKTDGYMKYAGIFKLGKLFGDDSKAGSERVWVEIKKFIADNPR